MLLRTITSAARKTLTALPFWPVPPPRAAMSSMTLSLTMLPSWRFVLCPTRLPPFPAGRVGVWGIYSGGF
jgi:hypothetical protein